jgi:hypothetical protein
MDFFTKWSWRSPTEKVVVRKQLRRGQVMKFFDGAAALPDWLGGLRHRALLGARVDETQPRGSLDVGEGREGLHQA